MTPTYLLLPLLFVVGCCNAFLEDLDSETVETATDERILAFNQEVIRCYKDAAGNVTDKGLGYESMACCIREHWLRCIRAVSLSRDCAQLLGNRIREFETAIVKDVDCDQADMRYCRHTTGPIRNQYFRAAAGTAHPIGMIACSLLAIFVLTAGHARLLL